MSKVLLKNSISKLEADKEYIVLHEDDDYIHIMSPDYIMASISRCYEGDHYIKVK